MHTHFTGITVHESGDDSKMETFDGFPWIVRLRYVMENAATIDEAREAVLHLLYTHCIGCSAVTYLSFEYK